MNMTPELFATGLRAFADAIIMGATPGSPTGGADKPKTTTKPKAEPEPEPEAHGIEYDTVSKLVVRISKEVGRDDAINFLATFKNPANGKPATKGAEIDEADYPRAVEEATKLLEDNVA